MSVGVICNLDKLHFRKITIIDRKFKLSDWDDNIPIMPNLQFDLKSNADTVQLELSVLSAISLLRI